LTEVLTKTKTRQCAHIKPSGKRCRSMTAAPSGLCFPHDPGKAEERRANARAAARAKGKGRPAQGHPATDESPPMPDFSGRRAEALRWEGARFHRRMAATLAGRVAHHEAAAEQLAGGAG
jgi:hypothetical protein